MAEGAIVLGMLALSLGAGLLLYFAVRTEGRQRESMSRADAERAARRDTSDPERTQPSNPCRE